MVLLYCYIITIYTKVILLLVGVLGLLELTCPTVCACLFKLRAGVLSKSLARNFKESIFIRVNNPTLNRNIGKFNLLHIWHKVLLNTPG